MVLNVCRYNPVFTQTYSETLTVRQVSLWEALCQSGSYPDLSPPEGVETLPLMDFVKAMYKKGAGPVVIFPEVRLHVADEDYLYVFKEEQSTFF